MYTPKTQVLLCKIGVQGGQNYIGMFSWWYPRNVRPAKIQISLRIHVVWSESSLGPFWITKDAKFLHADNEDSD